MIEKNIYENYSIDFKENYTLNKESYCFIFNENRQLYLTEDKEIPIFNQMQLKEFDPDFTLFIGKFNDYDVVVANTSCENNFHTLFELYEISHDNYQIASRAVLIRDWYKTHKYCGNCGSRNVLDKKDMMLICPQCGQMHYPRISPAIIVAINNDGKLLMAKHSYHKTNSYSIIAGFVEPGESIEEAVYREVLEEVGIKIKNLQYQRSQSWPFPNSLMLGFTADYDNGEISVDGDEIIDAKWFKPEEIDMLSSDISISSWLIKNFIKTHTGDK